MTDFTLLDKPDQFKAAIDASSTAPAAIKAIPKGRLAPEKARIAPIAICAGARMPENGIHYFLHRVYHRGIPVCFNRLITFPSAPSHHCETERDICAGESQDCTNSNCRAGKCDHDTVEFLRDVFIEPLLKSTAASTDLLNARQKLLAMSSIPRLSIACCSFRWKISPMSVQSCSSSQADHSSKKPVQKSVMLFVTKPQFKP